LSDTWVSLTPTTLADRNTNETPNTKFLISLEKLFISLERLVVSLESYIVRSCPGRDCSNVRPHKDPLTLEFVLKICSSLTLEAQAF